MTVNIFDHHDGIIDQDSDGKDEGEQRDAIEREAPCPRRKQGRGQRQDHRRTDDHRLAASQGDQHQHDDTQRGEDQLLDQLQRLVVGGRAVVAGDIDVDVRRDDRVAQVVDARDQGIRDLDGVLARLLGDADHHRRIFASVLSRCAVPDVLLGQRRAVIKCCHLLQKHGNAVARGDNHAADITRVTEERAGIKQHRTIVGDDFAHWRAIVGGQKRIADFGHRDAGSAHPGGVEPDVDGAPRAANGFDLAGAGHPLQIGFDRMRHPLEVCGVGGGILREQRQRDDRDVVDALGFDDGLQRAKIARQPILVGQDRVV